MRGEKIMRRICEICMQGSPPHARGKAVEVHAAELRQGDHPRMRGEKNDPRRGTLGDLGSPPHARGKDDYTYLASTWDGITPACAGKSKTSTVTILTLWDHPRMRGEKSILKHWRGN